MLNELLKALKQNMHIETYVRMQFWILMTFSIDNTIILHDWFPVE